MSRISKTVLGVPIDALYHCNIEAFGVEYWYSSGGIQATPARSFTHIHGFQPNDSIAYNTTKLKVSKVLKIKLQSYLFITPTKPVLTLSPTFTRLHRMSYPQLTSPTPSNGYRFFYLTPSSNIACSILYLMPSTTP